MIDFYTFPFGAGIGLLIGFLLSYVLLLKNIADLKHFQAKNEEILANVMQYLSKNNEKE